MNIFTDSLLASSEFAAARNFWLEKLSGEWTRGYVPYDYAHPTEVLGGKAMLEESITGQLFQQLLQLGNGSDQRVYMILTAGVAALLHRYLEAADILIGVPIFKQGEGGEYLNTVLPLRSSFTEEMSFKDLLLQVRASLTEATVHQNYPVKKLIDEMGLHWTRQEFPLFDMTVLLENIQDKKYVADLPCNLSFVFLRRDTELCLTVEYNPALYKKASLERTVSHLLNLLRGVLANPNLPLQRVEILATLEREQLLRDFNNTQKPFLQEMTLHQLFEAQVEKTPNQVAVYFADKTLTYQELNIKANQLAETLRAKGVGPDKIVGLLVERSFSMIIGVLGILKAGGAYLPIACDYPRERVLFMLQDSGTTLLLTGEDNIELPEFTGSVLNLQRPEQYGGNGANLPAVNNSAHLAYIIYTSGSTGRPKGVMIEHHSVINRLSWMQSQYQLKSEDVILQKTPYTFDVSVWELFWWGLYGAKVCFLAPGAEKDPQAIVEAIERYQITTMHFVPAMLSIFLKYVEARGCQQKLKTLRQVFASGEALNRVEVEKFRELLFLANDTRLHNLYGPTEATVDVTYFDCFASANLQVIPIGAPIDNIQLYIVGHNLELKPIGVPGELCIAGVGLARGYLNRPDLTKEKFVLNPFTPGEKMYRTGDLARWRADGKIEFLGRSDQQVKIRGYRIEPGEIENLLNAHPAVQMGVVQVVTDSRGEKNLCAYVVSTGELSVSDLKSYLGQSLPEYMIPVYFVRLEKLPLSSNGKLERKALPLPDASNLLSARYVAPQSELEQKLAHIWSDILQLQNVGIHDNFFELGGHSLRVTELTSRIYQEWGVEIPLKEIFNLLTIEKLAHHIAQTTPAKVVTIPIAEPQEDYPMASGQKRLFVLDRLMGPNTVYNLPMALHITGHVDLEQMQRAFNELITRHEAFRTGFFLQGEEAVQRIFSDVEFKLGFREAKEAEIGELCRNFARPFDLSKPPLIRGLLIKLAEAQYFLIIDIHHIIFDGVSAGILVREFAHLYNRAELSPLRLQYKDYAVWQEEFRQSEALRVEESYWIRELSGELPVLHLPYDYERPALQDFTGAGIDFELDCELTGKLNQLAQEKEATLFMMLLSMYTLLLAKCSGAEDIIIGIPVTGRPYLDLQNIIGMFVNTLPLRLAPAAQQSYSEFLQEAKEKALQGYANQDYQIEEIITRLKLNRNSERNPLFDVTFTMQNMNENIKEINVGELAIKAATFENNTAKFDLALYAVEVDGRLLLRLEYCTKLFKRETVDNFVKYFKRIAVTVTANPDILLKDITILDAAETGRITNQLLEEKQQLKDTFQQDFEF